MDYILKNEDFNIKKILESGQNFSYLKEENIYSIKINNKEIKIESIDNKTYFNINKDFFDKNLAYYFDINTDYKFIREEINNKFPELKKYTEFGKGLRFLNQNFLEVSTAFIISQNNNIKRIKNSIDKLINEYGKEGNFPELNILKNLSKEELRNLGIGFRDEYLYNFYNEIDDVKIKALKLMNTKEAFEELNKFKGIGPKVANCILLFGLNKRDVFPVDTHIKKVMENLYFKGEETSVKKIEEYALNKFGKYASYIQQYLFYYQINHKI